MLIKLPTYTGFKVAKKAGDPLSSDLSIMSYIQADRTTNIQQNNRHSGQIIYKLTNWL
jgi:hypothetical protein